MHCLLVAVLVVSGLSGVSYGEGEHHAHGLTATGGGDQGGDAGGASGDDRLAEVQSAGPATLEQWKAAHEAYHRTLDETLANAELPASGKKLCEKIHEQTQDQDKWIEWRVRQGMVSPQMFGRMVAMNNGLTTIVTSGRDLAIADTRLKGFKLSPEQCQAVPACSEAVSGKTAADQGVDKAFMAMPERMHSKWMNSLDKELREAGWDGMSTQSPGGPGSGASSHNERMGGFKDPNAQVYVGNSLARNGDLPGAERAFSNALGMDPNNLDALSGRAGARYNMGDFAGALGDARGALRVDPSNEGAKGIAQFAAGRLGPEMAAPKPDNPWAQDQVSLSGNLGGSALGARGSPESRESALLAAEAARQFHLGDLSSARRSLDRALELNPANADAHAKRGWLNAAQGQMSDAIADLRSVLKLDPKKGPAAVGQLAAELNKRGRYRDAKSLLELIRPEDRDARAWYHLAAAENGLGDRDAMMSALRRAAELDPGAYGRKLERAMSAAPEEDLSFLFDQVQTQAGKDGRGAQGRGAGGGRLLLMVLAVLVGGFLVALGLLHSMASTMTKRWTTRIRSAFGESPGVVEEGGELAAGAVDSPRTNRVGGNFELVRQIGLGGMGIVYEGMDTALGRRVAIKKMREEIRIDPRERERFIVEARTVAKLRHPGIVEIHSIVEDGDDVFLVFEYVDGSTLYELLDRRGRIPLPEAAKIVEQAGEALTFAHGRDIIHRDLKPSNIMLTESGTVKVMDFGVARQAKDAVSKLSMTNTIVGTPPYMAPEQEQGLVCRESDVYALAVCFYELVTGRLPFQGSGAGMLLNKMNKSYAPPSSLAPDLPSALDGLMAKAFEPDPARRFRTVAEFVSALRQVSAPSKS